MKVFPYTIVKKNQLQALQHKLFNHQHTVSVATDFVKAIAQGKLDVPYNNNDQADESNTLASSLVSMRDQMKNFAREESQRNWVSAGLAKFVDILRSSNQDIAVLSNEIITHLVKYLEANQGALYILNDDNAGDEYLEMAACYAYNRRKFLNQRFNIGEGLIGQVVLEKSTTYLRDIPRDYIRITSGLGEGLPSNLLIVPLKMEEQVLGLVEIASFGEIKKYQIDFVERLGESIASTISSVKTADRTRRLLTESQMQGEQMRAQEEEMRQNMEELSATQEEMQRVMKAGQLKETYLNNLMNSHSDAILTVDIDLKLVMFNEYLRQTFLKQGLVLEPGMSALLLANDQQHSRETYAKAFAGQVITEKQEYFGKQYEITTQPIRDNNNVVIGASVFTKDISHHVALVNDAQQKTEEMKAQEEELRQNMEELSATQDEMHRILQEVQGQQKYLNDLIDSSKDSILTVDRDYNVVNFNKTLRDTYSTQGLAIEKGFSLPAIFTAAEWPKFKKHYDRAFAGERFELMENHQGAYFVISYSPLRNEKDEVVAVSVFAKDTTQLIQAQKDVEGALLNAQGLQRYYNDVIEGMGDSVVTIDRDFTIKVSNKAFKKIFSGYGVPVNVGDNLLAMAKDKEEEFKRPYLRAFAGEFVDEPLRHHFDRDFHVFYNPLRDATGAIVGVSLIAHDITDRVTMQRETERLLAESQSQSEELKAQEEELRQNMEELSATQDEMQRHITRVDQMQHALEVRENVFGITTILSEADVFGNVTYVNEKLCRVSGYTREELIGKPHNIFRHPDMPSELFKAFWTTIKKGEVFKGIVKNKAKDGSAYWVDASIVPVKDDTGKVVKYIGARYHIEDEDMAINLYNKQATKMKLPLLGAVGVLA